MTKSFICDSESAPNPAAPGACARLEVDISISCRDRDGADSMYAVEYILNLGTKQEVAFESLPSAEQARIEAIAEKYADDYACEAAQEYAEGQADWLHDMEQDR